MCSRLENPSLDCFLSKYALIPYAQMTLKLTVSFCILSGNFTKHGLCNKLNEKCPVYFSLVYYLTLIYPRAHKKGQRVKFISTFVCYFDEDFSVKNRNPSRVPVCYCYDKL